MFQVHHVRSGGGLPVFGVQRFTQGPQLGASQGPGYARHGLGQGQGLGHLVDSVGESHCSESYFFNT